jgi:hypothetical protein
MGVFAGNTNSWWNLTGGTDSSRTYIATNKVVQSGLVLNLDAGASTSYPGSGTTWTDLSDKISSATGALPIYNTTGTYGAVKGSGTRTDTNASSLVLAVPMDGANNGTTFTDESATIRGSGSAKTITNNGSIPTLTAQSKFYGSSAYISNAGTQSLAFGNYGTDFQFTGDFTIECWVYPTTSGATDGSIFVLQSGGNNYFAFNFDPGTQFNIYNNSGSPSWSPSVSTVITGQWNHLAFVRSGSTQQIFVNGASIGTNTASGTLGYSSADFARIGGGASGAINSYIQDFRIYKGVAKYTANFTPPGNPNNGTLTNGPTYSSVSGGSLVFDGTNDYVTLGTVVLTTGATTISMWVYPLVSQTTGFANLLIGGGSGAILYQIGNIIMIGFRGNPEIRTTTKLLTLNTWQNITWVYNNGAKNSSSSFSIYLNGVAETAFTTFGSIGGSNTINTIGSDENGTYSNNRIATTQIYNRALTASEIQQNYNALRSRFGI